MAESFRKIYSPFHGGNTVWAAQNNAGNLARKEFFGELDTTGYVKHWNGTDWVLKPTKYWNGTAWVKKPVRHWNGSVWLLTEYGFGPNRHPNPLDIFAWTGTAGQRCTLSRDLVTGKSPYNGDPLSMVTTASDAFTNTYDLPQWNIAPAADGETWVVKVWAKASLASQCEIYIFGADNTGNWTSTVGTIGGGLVNVGTSWSEVSFAYTFAHPSVQIIQVRLDGPATGGTGRTIWWDNLQVYKII